MLLTPWTGHLTNPRLYPVVAQCVQFFCFVYIYHYVYKQRELKLVFVGYNIVTIVLSFLSAADYTLDCIAVWMGQTYDWASK